MRKTVSGFTIVELLIVIVVIAILAAVSIVAYNGAQDRAKISRANADLVSLEKAVQLARVSSGKVLGQITGSNCSRCSCPYASGDMTDYSTLPSTNSCWVRYNALLDAIEAASGAKLGGLRSGDPWGAPYSVDENEGENGGCGKDLIWSFGSSRTMNGGTAIGSRYISLSGNSGC